MIPGASVSTEAAGSTDIFGWTVGGHSVDYISGHWVAQDGVRSIDLAGNGIGSIAQTFDAVAGVTYNVAFWIGRNPDGGLNARTGFIDVGGVQTTFTYYGLGSRANMMWELNVYSFEATDTSTTLNSPQILRLHRLSSVLRSTTSR